MIFNKALKVRLYPTDEQRVMIVRTIGGCRKVYNEELAHHTAWYDENIRDREKALGRRLTKEERADILRTYVRKDYKAMRAEFDYLNEIGSVCLQWSLMDLETAFENFFKGRGGYPRFHKRGGKESFRAHGKSSIACDLERKVIGVPRIRGLRFRCSKYPEWLTSNHCVLKQIIVSTRSSGHCYASLLFEYEAPAPEKDFNDRSSAIGLDFSPAEMYIDSDGKSAEKDFNYIAVMQQASRRLARLQRRLARKQKGSRNQAKARERLARFAEHIVAKRDAWQGRETRRLVESHQVIGVEDLSIRGLMRASRNARNYNDAGWGTFVTRLEQKAADRNCLVVRVGRFFASSKTCSKCGHVKRDLRLSDRVWVCPSCGTRHQRDINAAVNIRNEAVRIVDSGWRPKERVRRTRFKKKSVDTPAQI